MSTERCVHTSRKLDATGSMLYMEYSGSPERISSTMQCADIYEIYASADSDNMS